MPEGTPVYAADNGKVIVAGDLDNGYGSYIILDHQNGYKTLYAHNSELLVSVGDIVAQGDQIALSGNTGNSTGPHVHFEIQVNDERSTRSSMLRWCDGQHAHFPSGSNLRLRGAGGQEGGNPSGFLPLVNHPLSLQARCARKGK